MQGILKNISWLTIEQILRMSIGLFVGLWVARYLGPDEFGIFNYVTTIALLLVCLSNLGLEQVVLKDIIINPDNNKVIATALVVKMISSTFVYILSILVIYIIFNANNNYYYISFLVVLFSPFNVIDIYFQSKGDNKFSVISRGVQLISSSILKIILILNNYSILYFFILFAIEQLIVALLYFYFLKNKVIFNFKNIDLKLIPNLLGRSWPFLLSAIMVTVYMKIDTIMIGLMKSDSVVGVYSAAARISELWYFIPNIIMVSVMPILVKKHCDNKLSFNEYYLRILKIINIMSISIICFVLLFSNEIVNLLYGVEYKDASRILDVHVIGCFFAFTGIVSSRWFVINELQKFTLIRTSVGAFSNIMLNLILIPEYGALGAAIATVLSQVLSGYLINLFNKKTREIFILQSKAFVLWKM